MSGNTLRQLETQRADLAARVRSMVAGGYQASAYVLRDRLVRVESQIEWISAHHRGAVERKVLVTPSNLSQFETLQRQNAPALARNTVVHG